MTQKRKKQNKTFQFVIIILLQHMLVPLDTQNSNLALAFEEKGSTQHTMQNKDESHDITCVALKTQDIKYISQVDVDLKMQFSVVNSLMQEQREKMSTLTYLSICLRVICVLVCFKTKKFIKTLRIEMKVFHNNEKFSYKLIYLVDLQACSQG